MKNARNIPLSTYRIQFNSLFTFFQAKELIEYLYRLGISHLYASPLLKAKKGSTHGYDIVNHSELNPEVGTVDQFKDLVDGLNHHQMGVICDIVPNHMYIMDTANKWWSNVLENGPSSPFACYFDIDWHPPHHELIDKVLLPILDQQYGEALENQSIKIAYRSGAFRVELPGVTLATDPCSWISILEPVAEDVGHVFPPNGTLLLELKSIITALSHLPKTTEISPEKIEERQREKEIIKRRLTDLMNKSPEISQSTANFLELLNGKKGDSRSFDKLEAFLYVQSYRLCFWRVANDEINYRRFFDIFEFAGIRTEKSEVFEAIHTLIFHLVKKKLIDGLRIDHIDGLWDPLKYLTDLQKRCNEENPDQNIYIIVEKILIGDEKLRTLWPVHGTVGYDYLNFLNGIFVVQANKSSIHEIYRKFCNPDAGPYELSFACKKLILLVSMSSELYVLSRHLDRISEQHRSSRDFTAESLRAALRDVIACFPVYRSYIREDQEKISSEDKQHILSAVAQAKRRNPAMNASIFDFIQNILLLEHPSGLNETQKSERVEFVMRFQQLTPPVMAKGLEDTEFYRYYPLVSLNEVGANPYYFGFSLDAFHKKNIDRFEQWPHSMLATSTHDTKRSEDVRARINVLSEIPDEWEQMLVEWSGLNKVHKLSEDDESVTPDANEEYLLYQSLIGSWPLTDLKEEEHRNYVKRIQAYMEKAIKEAKVHTSWISPNKNHDNGVLEFVHKILEPHSDNAFLSSFKKFIPKIIALGMLNSLSQTLIKLTCPGVPDIYQGNEIWDFSLVDPDNRRPVDYLTRNRLLKNLREHMDPAELQLKGGIIPGLLQNPQDGAIKMWYTMKVLNARLSHPNLFRGGEYLPLQVEGPKQNHIIAFARKWDGHWAITLASRFFSSLIKQNSLAIDPSLWKGTNVQIPQEVPGVNFRDILTGRLIEFKNSIPLENAFSMLSQSLLIMEDPCRSNKG